MDITGCIWVALDTTKEKALEIAQRVYKHPAVKGFKTNRLIDQEVFRKDGDILLFQALADLEKPVWADLKLIDVPRTVAGRIEPYADSGQVQFITVMAKGEIDMMMAAVKAGGNHLSIIAVTELTSLSEEQIHLGSGNPTKASVINLARNTVLSEIRYLVCSSKEIAVIGDRQELRSLELFVPGITPAWKSSSPSDQKRIGTPAFVLDPKNGENKKVLVIGSAIIDAADPLEAVEKTAAEVAALEL